jgi:hypothetical protein
MRRVVVLCGLALAAAYAHASETPRIFVTSVSGNGNLSSWADAGSAVGIDAGDAICRARASAAAIPDAERYVALLSDSQNDAYCRLHGDSGLIDFFCNEDALPSGAGPWYRMDGLAAMDVAQNAVGSYPDGGYVPRPILYDEFGHEVPDDSTGLAFTSTTWEGFWTLDSACSEWTSDDASLEAALGSAFDGYGDVQVGSWDCGEPLRLICLESGRDGTPLQRSKPPSARIAFETSALGGGDFSAWPDANGATSIAAADNICRAAAGRAMLPLAGTYKAWLSTSTTDAIERFENDGAWYRTDGVRAISSLDALASGRIEAPLQFEETGRVDFFPGSAWTGTLADGTLDMTHTCEDWTNGTDDAFGSTGTDLTVNGEWTHFGAPFSAFGCGTVNAHIYCLADNDSLFRADFD